jgi:hypothetical protein
VQPEAVTAPPAAPASEQATKADQAKQPVPAQRGNAPRAAVRNDRPRQGGNAPRRPGPYRPVKFVEAKHFPLPEAAEKILDVFLKLTSQEKEAFLARAEIVPVSFRTPLAYRNLGPHDYSVTFPTASFTIQSLAENVAKFNAGIQRLHHLWQQNKIKPNARLFKLLYDPVGLWNGESPQKLVELVEAVEYEHRYHSMTRDERRLSGEFYQYTPLDENADLDALHKHHTAYLRRREENRRAGTNRPRADVRPAPASGQARQAPAPAKDANPSAVSEAAQPVEAVSKPAAPAVTESESGQTSSDAVSGNPEQPEATPEADAAPARVLSPEEVFGNAV